MASLIKIDALLMKVKNRRLVVALLPVLAGLFLGGTLIIKPAVKNFTSVKAQLETLKEKEASYYFILGVEKKLAEQKEPFTGKDKTWLIEQLNVIAEETGFSILSISPEDPKKLGEFLEQTSVQIEARADYHQLGEFVSRAEGLGPFFRVLSLGVYARGGAGEDSLGHEIDMSVGLLTAAPGVLG